MRSHIGCLRRPTATCEHRVLGVTTHIVVTVVLHALSTKLPVAKHEERPVLVLQRQVHAKGER